MAQAWFLDIDHTLRLHRSLIDTYGGIDGIRDVGLLHSALAMPQSSFGGEFLHKDLFEMAAAYMYHLVQNHPFLDGNKRTGAAAAIIFLAMNDVELSLMKKRSSKWCCESRVPILASRRLSTF